MNPDLPAARTRRIAALAVCMVVGSLVLGTSPATTAARKATLSPATRSDAAQLGRALVRGSGQAQFTAYMEGLEANNPHGNIGEVLFVVFRESIEQMNKDKKYYLGKLERFNAMGEALSEYLAELTEASKELSSASAGSGAGDLDDDDCSGSKVTTRTDRLDRAAARIESLIPQLPPAARQSTEVRELSQSLRRDRQLIALARRKLLAARSRPAPPAGLRRADQGEATPKVEPPDRRKPSGARMEPAQDGTQERNADTLARPPQPAPTAEPSRRPARGRRLPPKD
ncbi:MAG: hypothetical protein CL910_07395 [Deltaproteobacteria bacterium]|nr:hypothetical protein [Deltaproteobacteria bacterium]